MDIFTQGPHDVYYRAIRDVIAIPETGTYDQVRRIAVDSRGRMYIAGRDLRSTALPPVTIYEPDGTYVGGWGHGIFSGLHGIFITPDDIVFLVDTELHQIFKCTLAGEVLMTIGGVRPSLGGPFNHPSDVTVSEVTGNIYVADGDGNTRVHAFTAEGEHLRTWGEPGYAPGELVTPHSIAVDADERIYVGDRDRGYIVVFTSEGEFVREWRDILHRPADIFMDQETQILYVVDTICRVHMYDTAGTVLGRAHAAAPPHSICVGADKSVYLCFPSAHPFVEKWVPVANELTT
jgi:DNA-binding beta-propeller fold protein YncE